MIASSTKDSSNLDRLASKLSPDEIIEYKGQICHDLYWSGMEFPAWSTERAKFWYESIILFADTFVKLDLPRPEFHSDWYWWSVSERAYMNLSPRDHAKTTVHSVIRPTWEICMNRNIRLFLLFATLDVGKIVLAQIKNLLSRSPEIKTAFGAFNPAELPHAERLTDTLDWSQTSITVNRDDLGIKDPTIAITGSLSNVLSRRADRLYVDDLLTDKIASSEAESRRLVSWYYNDVQPVLVSDGQEMIVGTPYKAGDFYDEIQKQSVDKGGLYRIFIGDAIVDEERHTTLWPERWSWEGLMRQKSKMGSVRFNRNYRCRVVDDENSPFPMVWFEGGYDRLGTHYDGCFDDKLVLGDRDYPLKVRVTGVDPAIGEKRDSKYFALVTLGIDDRNKIVVADLVRRKAGFIVQRSVVVNNYLEWNPRFICVETNSYQQALAEGVIEQHPLIPLVTFTTGVNKSDAEVGVESMDVFFEMGRVAIPRGDQRSIALTDQLVHELHFLGKTSTSDLVMSFWFALTRLKGVMDQLGILTNVENTFFGSRAGQGRIRSLHGMPIPVATAKAIRVATLAGPWASRSPLRSRYARFRKNKAKLPV